jgi:hypothetical protein
MINTPRGRYSPMLICEDPAKGVSDRESIRTAVGQLLDYRRHIVPKPAVAVLLPDRPSADLLSLLDTEGIGCVFEDRIGSFRDVGSEHGQRL